MSSRLPLPPSVLGFGLVRHVIGHLWFIDVSRCIHVLFTSCHVHFFRALNCIVLSWSVSPLSCLHTTLPPCTDAKPIPPLYGYTTSTHSFLRIGCGIRFQLHCLRTAMLSLGMFCIKIYIKSFCLYLPAPSGYILFFTVSCESDCSFLWLNPRLS